MKGTVAFCWLVIFIIFVTILNELAKKNKNANDNLLTYIIILVLFFSAPFAWWVISTPSPLGFIEPQHQEAWLGFFGSIIGGALTIFGVWWTLERQEEQRREDMILHYLPILTISDRKIDITDFGEFGEHLDISLKIDNNGSGIAKEISIQLQELEYNPRFKDKNECLLCETGTYSTSFIPPKSNCTIHLSVYKTLQKDPLYETRGIGHSILPLNVNTIRISGILSYFHQTDKNSEYKLRFTFDLIKIHNNKSHEWMIINYSEFNLNDE